MVASPSQRQLRAGELVRHALGDMLTRDEVLDPDYDMRMITVPEVRMSPDLKNATAYIMPLGGQELKLAVEACKRNAKFMRGILAKKVTMKFVPNLFFRVDDSFERGAKIDKLLGIAPVVSADDDA